MESNHQAKRGIQNFKTNLKKDPGGDINKMVLTCNSNLQPGMKATALAIFLGRPPRSMLPNSYWQRMDIQEELVTRRAEQERSSRKRGRYNRDKFEEGDPVVIQDQDTRTWKKAKARASYTQTGRGNQPCYS